MASVSAQVVSTVTGAGVREPRLRPGRMPLLVACLSVAAAVAGLVLREIAAARSLPLGDEGNNPLQVLPLAVTFSVCGAVLLGYGSARPVGAVMLVSGALTAAGGFGIGLGLVVASKSSSFSSALNVVGGLGIILGLLLALVGLPQVFPDGLLPGRGWGLVALASLGAVMLSVLNLVVVNLLVGDQDWPWSLFAGVVIGAGVAAVVTLVVRWLAATGPVRRQIVVFGVASAIPVLLLLAGLVPGLQDVDLDWVAMFWPIGTVIAVWVAVTKYDLYDIRGTVRRAGLYAVTVALLSGVFAVVYFVVLGALSARPVGGPFRWLAVVAATVVILAVDPIRRRVMARAERRLLGQRSDPLPALARIGVAASPDGYTTIVDTVATALRSPGVLLAVRNRDEVLSVASTGDPGADPVVLPLSYAGELVGELVIAPRTPGERFQPADRTLLSVLAQQAATQLYVARRDAELTRVRQETLQQSAALRAQLGQDLHDGLAPLLAGASLTADALRRGMAPGSTDEHDAARLTDRLREAATEVRRLAHNLQPAVLDRGLDRAIRDHIAGLGGPGAPAVTAEVRVDGLPAAVIEAAYLIVLEAMNNAVRHGHPDRVWIRVEQTSVDVSIVVEDDGTGIAQPYISGLGISSMRRRADALGGGLQLLPRPGGGTTVSATLRTRP